ncbi:hypothetical protein PUR49_08190 [Streptomyces sp. BE147]|nr:hypothetical protein [Streptomyces sp. BE147]MEE1736478.1 hypothetical protein [Streptomyces sp. BE147]
MTLQHRPAVRGTVIDLWLDLNGTRTAYVAWQTEALQDVPVRDLHPA